jgi:hypothetical protein
MSTTFDQTRARLAIRLLNGCGTWLCRAGIPRGPLQAAELISTARRRARFEDFGQGDFIEALTHLLKSCENEARLNVIGKIALRSDILRTLCNRFAMERDRHALPAITQQQIRAPLFIVGLPRSGTTLLHTLLACDPAHRAPLTWEILQPSPPSTRGEGRRIRSAAKCLYALQWLAPTFRHVHATGAELPQECVGMMSPSFLSDQFDTMFNVPSYRAWFFSQNLLPAYEFHRRFLQHLQYRRPAERWILKAPAHMFALPTLLEVYPDALFVQTHRNPLEAIASVSSLIAILRSVFSDEVDPQQIGHDAIEYWSRTLISFSEARDRHLRGRICDLHYNDIRRDPLGAVRRVYHFFGWPLSRLIEENMRATLTRQPREQHGFHRYNPAQFGLENAPQAKRFRSYCDRFGLTLPTEIEETERAA